MAAVEFDWFFGDRVAGEGIHAYGTLFVVFGKVSELDLWELLDVSAGRWEHS